MTPAETLQALLQPLALASPLYPPNSRYNGVATAVLDTPAGPVAYLRRRFVPAPAEFATVQEYVVARGDRPDLVAAQFLGDPLLFWRLCDANGVLRPENLTDTPGRRLRITLPRGVPGVGTGGAYA
jgi:hypothetical protein